MGDLEEKISEKKFSFSIKDLRWIIGIVITIIGWGVTAYLWVQDKSEMKEEIVTLGSENKLLNEKVIRLEGQVEGVNNAAEIFMKNSPSENRYRIETLEKRVDVLELPGSNPPAVIDTAEVDTTRVVRRNRPNTNGIVD